nr:multidrug resistance-associated protein 5 [Tanacetum cinerariifolium]
MFDVEEILGRLTLYLDHLDMNLLEYLSQAITYDMDDLVSKKICPPKKRYCNDFSIDEHTCVRNFNFGALVNYKWIAKIFGDKIRANPDIRSYGKAILDFNPGFTVKLKVTVNPDGKTYFDRFYVCFAGLADGWKAAMGNDVNNHIYPVAWAVVNVEYKDNWTWFLELLEEDLGCSRGNELTLMFWHAIPADENLFKVRSGSKGFIVDDGKRTCSCRMWQLSGLPCVHATKVIFLINRVLESYVPVWFETDMYIAAYHNYVKLVLGMNFWPDQSMYSTVLPPKPRKIPGRPRKKRIRAIGEGGSSTRISKVYPQGSCSNCKKLRHNKSSCKKPIVEQKPKPKGVIGKPRKKQPVDDFEDVDVVQRGPVRDEGASRTRGGAIGSRGKEGRRSVAESSGGASGSIGRGAGGSSGSSGSRGRDAGGSDGASGSKGRGVGGYRGRGAGGSKRNLRQLLEHKKDKTQAESQQTQHEPEHTQVEDQVEQTEDQAEIDLTQLEQTQEST